MSQSPVWPAAHVDAGVLSSDAARPRTAGGAALQKPTSTYARLSPLQTAAATAVIFTSLAVLAAMTGIFSTSAGDEPLPVATSTSPLRSAGGPVPVPAAVPAPAPQSSDRISEVDPGAPSLRSSQSLAAAAAVNSQPAPANSGAVRHGGNPDNTAPRIVPVIPAPRIAAATPALSRHAVRHTAASREHRAHRRREHAGKTREQVIDELMQAKRDGSYRALQENYR